MYIKQYNIICIIQFTSLYTSKSSTSIIFLNYYQNSIIAQSLNISIKSKINSNWQYLENYYGLTYSVEWHTRHNIRALNNSYTSNNKLIDNTYNEL